MRPATAADPHKTDWLLVVREILPALVLLVGLATLVGSVYIVIVTYTPVWFADEWQVPMDYKALGGHYPLWKFWQQHNEHRIPFMKALQLLELFWLKGDHRPSLVLNGLIQVCLWCALTSFLYVLRRFSTAELATLSGITAFCVFNPNQLQNFEWAFQGTFLSANMFAVMALAGVSLYAHYEREPHREHFASKWLILAVSAAFLAECNLASGVLTWAILPVCAVLLGVRPRISILLSGVAVAGIGVYMIGYHAPDNLSDPFRSIRHIDLVFGFVVAYFAESWHFVIARFGPAVTAITFFAIGWIVIRTIRRPGRWEPLEAFAFSLVLMMLLNAFITALGRQANGLEQAREGRYQTPAMLFWLAFALLLIAQLTTKGLRSYRTHVFVGLQVAFLGVFAAEARWFPKLLALHLETRTIRNTAGLAVEAGIYDESPIRSIYPMPSAVPPTYRYMVEQRLMAPPFDDFHYVGKTVGSIFAILPAGSCLGSTEVIRRIALRGAGRGQELFVSGWGYYPAGKEAFGRMVAATPEGIVVGIGISGISRRDVTATHPEPLPEYVGWRLYAVSEGSPKPLHVYGILPGRNEACLLPGTNTTPSLLAPQALPPHFSMSGPLAGFIERLNGEVIGNANDGHNPVRIGRADNLLIEGWVVAGDLESAMDQVFGVYPGGNAAAVVESRSDVADHFKNSLLLMSGFRIMLPAGTLGRGIHPIQIVGLRNSKYYKLPAVLYVEIS